MSTPADDPTVNLLKNQNDYLTNQYVQADSRIKGNQRNISFNENYRKKQVEYNKIILFILFSVIVVVIYGLFRDRVTFMPTTILDAFVIVFLTFAFVHIIYSLYDISRRDANNFDELNSTSNIPTNTGAVNSLQLSAQQSGDILGSYAAGQCFGNSCCTDGTTWDASSNLCIPVSSQMSGNLFISNSTVSSVPGIQTGSTLVGTSTIYSISSNNCSENSGLKICGQSCVPSSQICH